MVRTVLQMQIKRIYQSILFAGHQASFICLSSCVFDGDRYCLQLDYRGI